MLPGCQAPTAEADGDAPRAAEPSSESAGSPVMVAAAGLAVFAAIPESRRVVASAVHINGAASGASPSPEPNQDNRFESETLTDVEAVAGTAETAGAESSRAPVATSIATSAGWEV